MEKKYAIILFKAKEYLCGHEDGCHYDVSCPVRTFTEGEDDFKIQESGKNRSERTFRYHEKEFRLVTGFYPTGPERSFTEYCPVISILTLSMTVRTQYLISSTLYFSTPIGDCFSRS